MEIKENSQKKVLLSVLGVAILVVAVVGISFAAFTLTQTSETNTVTTGTLMVSYSEDSTEINITDAMPMSDADALSNSNLQKTNESFIFTVATNASATSSGVTIPYDISLTPVDGNTLTNNEVKVYLTKGGEPASNFSNGGVVAPKLVSALSSYTGHSRTGSFLLHSDSDVYTAAGGNKSTEYVLKMWIDENVEVSFDEETTVAKTYGAKVNVDSAVKPIGQA